MYKFILSSLLIITFCYQSAAQTEIGIEIGNQETLLFSVPKAFHTNYYEHHIGMKVGLFLEREINPKLGLRVNLFYDLRHFDISKRDLFVFHNYHTLSLPIKVIFKAGKIVHFGLGAEPMLLFPLLAASKKPLFHIGPCAEMAFRIRKMMRLSFYCHYDLVHTNYDKHGNFTNLTAGVSFAFTIRKMKKRRVIYSP